MRALRIIGGVAVLTAIVATGAHAQSNEKSKLTYLTFSGPVEVPGATLPAGRYMFKMADTLGGSHAVQIFSGDGKKVYTTFFAVPDQKPSSDVTPNTVLLFDERPAGSPQAIKMWYYPGNPAGEEFVYPRKQALRIAKANHMAVLSAPDDSSKSSSQIARVDENGQVSGSTTEIPAAAQVARNQEPANPAVGTGGQSDAARPARTTLPRTASNLSAIQLLSALFLVGAMGLRRFRVTTGVQ